MTKQYVNAARAAEILHRSEKTVRRWIKKGLLPAEKDGDNENSPFLIAIEELERLQDALQMGEREAEIRLVQAEVRIRELEERLARQARELHERPSRQEVQWQIMHTIEQALATQPSLAAPVGTSPSAITSEAPAPSVAQQPLLPLSSAESAPSQEAEAATQGSPRLPPGSMLVAHFARAHLVDRKTLFGQIANPRLNLSMTSIDRGARDGSQQRWLTPEQQARVVEYWRVAGKPFTRCSLCPHASSATISSP